MTVLFIAIRKNDIIISYSSFILFLDVTMFWVVPMLRYQHYQEKEVKISNGTEYNKMKP